ncbi:hypothetical protein ACJ41O_012677 [Fusarium nematophilum]
MRSPIRTALYVALGLLMIVSIVELSFISVTVGWLHDTASGNFAFRYRGSIEEFAATPKNFILDQGHTSNGAAGTAFVLIGTGGFLILSLLSLPRPNKLVLGLYHLWLVVNVLSLLLTLAALIYVFVVTNNHKGQTIDPSVAARLSPGEHYYLDTWTPQNWFSAVLKLDLVGLRGDIANRLRIMRGWQYNLIPFFIVHLTETSLAICDALQRRREPKGSPSLQKSTV